MLSGKNKEIFEQWLPHNIQVILDGLDGRFETLQFELQIGLLISYYSEHNFHIQSEYKHNDGWTYSISYLTHQMNPYKRYSGKLKCIFHYDVMMIKAFQKADEIANSSECKFENRSY